MIDTAKILRLSSFLRYPIFWLLFRLFFKKNLLKHKNTLAGQSILIVGNGPSLNSTPLEKFKIKSIGMNKIDLIFKKTSWRPDYIFCNNGIVAKQNAEIFKNSKIPIFLGFKSFFLGLISKNIEYFLESPLKNFSTDFEKFVGTAGTVTYSCLQFASFLGVKKIFLVGIDHNFKGFDNNNIPKIEKFKGEDINHFDSNYFKNQKWGTPNLGLSEIGYKLAYEHCINNEIKIYDATYEGKLKIFPKITIENALKMIHDENN